MGNDPLSFVDPTGQSIGIPIPYRFPRFTGKEAADWLDARIGAARGYLGFDPPLMYNPFMPTRPGGVFASMSASCDMLRIGSEIDRAFAPDENVYGRAAFIAIETERFANLFAALAGPFAGRVGDARPQSPPPQRSFNPFKGKTPTEIDAGFRHKGFQTSGPDPINGYGGYINPRSGRSYHIDPKEYGRFREPNHVDVNRPRGYRGLDKRKFDY